ncbi:MAG: sugar ABC transporter permease, partial [Lachnospiraceae bacterium]|nr:sugar ABC transporter permease [Lachnospiraceae bacterium]
MANKYLDILKKNAMLIVLVLVYIFFTIMTGGNMFQAMNFNALITQNAYVYILATGMLMCMLTGGNIDLSCGSFVCFLGSVGAVLLAVKNLNTGISIGLMILIGVVYGCVLGFLIAYVNVPPWIATLAGFLAFRGLGTEILSQNSTTGSISLSNNEGYLKLFSGKLFSTPIGQLNMVCLIVGILAAVAVVVINFMTRARKVKKGYEADSLVTVIVKSVLSVAVIMLFTYKLAMSGGIPTVLVWVAIIVLVYSFITSKTNMGRYFYTIGDNAETTRLSGINTKLILFLAYLNMAVLTAVTTFIVTARFQAANST